MKAKCASCGKVLNGVPRKNIRKLSKTERRPERPLGGIYCSVCTKEFFRERARNIK